MIFDPFPRFVFPTRAPSFLAGAKLPSMKLLQVKMPFVVQCLSEDRENDPQRAGANPMLKAAMARLVRGIAVEKIGPGSACPQDPQDFVEHCAVLFPGASTTILTPGRYEQEGLKDFPLIVAGVTRSWLDHPARMARATLVCPRYSVPMSLH